TPGRRAEFRFEDGHAVIVRGCVDRAGEPAAREEVFYLADTDDRVSGRFHLVHDRCLKRFERKVPAIRCAREVPWLADEGAGNHPADTHATTDEIEGDAADAVQLVDGNHRLMSGDLKHGVRGR